MGWRIRWDASTEEIPVAPDIINPTDRRPKFLIQQPRCGIGRLFARVWVEPFTRDHRMGGMGGIFEGIIARISGATFHGDDLGMDGNQRRTKAIEFCLGLTLGGLDHQRSNDWPAESWGVEPVVHQTLSHIFCGDFRESAKVENTLVSDQPLSAFKEHGKVGIKDVGHIVGVEDGESGGIGNP